MPSWVHSIATYYRFKTVSVVPEGVSRVLYLDVDMLVFTDLRELFAMDFKGKMLIRTGDACYSRHDNRIAKSLNKNLKDYIYTQPRGTYFNAGFMLINAQKWRTLDIEKKLFEFTQKYVIEIGDQDVLNFIIKDDTIKINENWNFFVGIWTLNKFGMYNPFFNEDKNPYWGFTRENLSKYEKEIKILHFTHYCVKPWQSYYHSLDTTYKPVKYPYYDTWWYYALDTPEFSAELKTLQDELIKNALLEFTNVLGNKLVARDRIINERENALRTENLRLRADYEARLAENVNQAKFELLNLLEPRLTSAVVRVKSQLSYKLGSAIIKYSKNFGGNLTLPFVLFKIYLAHKKEVRIYKERVFYNPNLKLPLLETYADFNEALKVKNHLSYKLGSAFLKGLKTWYKFGLIKFYFEAKRLEKEFKKSKIKFIKA